MKKEFTVILVSGLFVLCTSFINKPTNNDEKAAEVSSTTALDDTIKQLIFYTNGNNPKLTIANHIKAYSKIPFPEKTIINMEGISYKQTVSAFVMYSDSTKYYVSIGTEDGAYISIQDRQGNPLGSGTIFSKQTNPDYTSTEYSLITPNDIRFHGWIEKKNNSEMSSEPPLIESDDYIHFHIDEKGRVSKVEKPKNIVDYFSIIPNQYLQHTVEEEYLISSYPDLGGGGEWYCTYISKECPIVVDIKNGYVELRSKMAQFNTNGVSYFVLVNSTGGKCDKALYHYFLTHNEKTKKFTQISDNDILPDIDKFELFEQPDLIRENFKEEQIQLEFIPPRYGTIMKLKPYINECGVDDNNLLAAMKQTKSIGLKWNRTLAKFERVPLN